jgi:protease II
MENTVPQARSITTIDKLEIGDRFVFAKDKKQRKFTKVAHEIERNKYTVRVYWALQDGQKYPVSLSSNTILKFLRRPEKTGTMP